MWPKHYSLVKDADKHFEIHDKRDNSIFKVAKKELHPASQIKVMKNLPKYSDGGEVDDEDSPENQPDESTASDVAAEDAQLAGPAQIETPQAPAMESPAAPQFVPQFAQGEPQAPAGWQAPMLSPEQQAAQAPADNQVGIAPAAKPEDPYAGLPGVGMMAQGIKQQGAAQSQLGRAQDAALQNYQKNLDNEAKLYQERVAGIDAEQEKLRQDLASGKVDSNRLFKNQGTGERISTVLGVILGGIGAGLLGSTQNMAWAAIQKAIDRDVDDQKASLGKTKTLLDLNMQKYRDTNAAEAATRLQYNTALQTQLQSAMAKHTTAQGQAAMSMQLGNLQQQAQGLKNTMALNTVKSQQLGVGNGEGGIPEGGEPAALLTDPKYMKNRVVVNGKAYQASEGSAGKVRDVETMAGPILSGVNELKSLADDPSTKVGGTPSNLKAHAIMGDLAIKLPLMSGAMIGAKRINEAEIQHQMERLHDPTRMDQTMGSIKTDQFFKSLEDDVESVRSNHIIGYKGMNSVKSFSPASGKLPLNGKR